MTELKLDVFVVGEKKAKDEDESAITNNFGKNIFNYK